MFCIPQMVREATNSAECSLEQNIGILMFKDREKFTFKTFFLFPWHDSSTFQYNK